MKFSNVIISEPRFLESQQNIDEVSLVHASWELLFFCSPRVYLNSENTRAMWSCLSLISQMIVLHLYLSWSFIVVAEWQVSQLWMTQDLQQCRSEDSLLCRRVAAALLRSKQVLVTSARSCLPAYPWIVRLPMYLDSLAITKVF